MSTLISLVIIALLFVSGLSLGFTIGKTLASMKYSTRIDNLNKIIDDREDELNRVYEEIRKGKHKKNDR